MSKVLELSGPFKILATQRDYIVINTTLEYSNHAHFKRLDALKHLLYLIELGKAPTSPYLVKAAKRLLGDEFHKLQIPRKKQPYKNNRPKSH